ncbi:HsdR family type I site-specific deoxyribonuclease [Micrococcus luteus]|uniref:type I restriction endonuclease subunit R n=1 Tax=Micrococcus luteus TaxID=1270 RepID=UPI002A425232|nr:HsdR family type I site-specific deoxyribonuclease [Micrococcus luteus]
MFNEANTVRDLIRDVVAEQEVQFIAGKDLPRHLSDVLLRKQTIDALIHLNPEIAAHPERADQVLYELEKIIDAARHGSLIRQNEVFAAWVRGERSMPFGQDGAHATVRLIDFEEPYNNEWVVSTEVIFRQGHVERRFDTVVWCNGIPLAVVEAKRVDDSAYSWFDAAWQVHSDYEKNVPMFFVPNVLSAATEGKDFRYGTVGMPEDLWGPWREEGSPLSGMQHVGDAAAAVLSPDNLLLFAKHYTLFATDSKSRRIKIIARYQQFQTSELIVARVAEGSVKKGLVWHFQGSGKSLLMVFASMRLRTHPDLGTPTVFIVVDRIDLDTQITGTFNASDVPNMQRMESRAGLERVLRAGSRKVIITTIHKFASLPADVDERESIVVLVDEAHRTQEGNMAGAMRAAIPNAFFFGMTGTPINSRDRNTFREFGAEEDKGHYLSKYSFQDSIRDGATLPLHFQPRPTALRVDREAIDAAFDAMVEDEHLTDAQKRELSKRGSSLERVIKSPRRMDMIAADVAQHFREHVDPLGFKAQVVVFDKEACVLFKEAFDRHWGDPDASTVVISTEARDPQEWRDLYGRDRDAEEALLDRFRDPADPLKVLIVTAKLLTGFDAPILQVQYLDRPLKDHTLLQAICRTNRVYPAKEHGVVVDYLGIFDHVAEALDFDEENISEVITNIEGLKDQFPGEMQKALDFFPGVDRTESGYIGMMAAQAKLPDKETMDAYGAQYRVVSRLWEALSPDAILRPHEDDYKWLTSVYESVKPVDLTGRLIWNRLGAKTLELVNQHVTVQVPRLDLDTIVMDEHLMDELASGDPRGKAKEIERAITARISRHLDDPKFIALGKRLEQLRDRYAQGQQDSIDFLRGLLEVAKDTVAAEKEVEQVSPEERAKAALTELFEALKTEDTPIMVERLVNDIDEVVRTVRYDGWQVNDAGEKEVRKVVRQILWVRYKLRDEDVFEKAVGYIREYY